MKKAFYGLCALAVLTTVPFGAKSVTFGQEPIVNQTEDQSQEKNQISKIEIEPYSISKNHSQYDRLTCGSNMTFLVKVYLQDGSIATNQDAEVKCELRKKDGTAANAVYSLKNPEYPLPQDDVSQSEYAKINIYAPYGYEEDLELVVSSVQDQTVKQTYAFKTVSDERDGVSISRYKLGTTAGNVSVAKAKESWDAKKKEYTVTLPKVKAKNSADVFTGWKDEKGNVYASGKKVRVGSGSLHEFQAVWENQQGKEFTVKVEHRYTTRYKITGKDTVALTKHTGIQKGLYTFEIPNTVEFHNQTYKVETIAKSAFSNTSVQKLIIGKNVKKMDKKALGKNMFLKTITIRSKKIESVGTDALKKVKNDVTIQCPKAKVKAYTRLFQKAGLNKNVKIKAI
ncbi:MAG: leucine-rich repeat protein [Lachnospiraceae bacterium]